MEENTEETGEQGVFPPTAHETSNPGRKRYGSFGEFINSMPKLAPKPAPKQGPSLHDHYNRMASARERFKDATAAEEARSEKLAKCQEELWVLEEQRGVLEKQKASAIESVDKKKLTDLNQDIEILQFQVERIKIQMADLQHGEDCKTILQEVRKTEQQFYGTVLEGYKNEITNGKCKIPFSELIAKAYALACQCGTGNVVTYLFQWTSVPSLVGEDIERLLKGIEAEYEK